jgi:hypothetical protein
MGARQIGATLWESEFMGQSAIAGTSWIFKLGKPGRNKELTLCVGGTGIEPATSSVSGKRSPAELTARDKARQDYRLRVRQTKCGH